MAKTYQPYDPNQVLLMPPRLDDWLPKDHLARFVSDTIDAADLSPIYAYYEREERGYPPYHPIMMVKVFVHGYCVGVRSSRKLEQACLDQVAFRYLAAGSLPKHSALGEFRRTHIGRLNHLFKQVLKLAQRGGFVKMGTVSLDGTKMKANAALDQNRTLEDLRKEDEELDRVVKHIMDEAEAIDQAEDEAFGKDNNPYVGLPPGWRTKKERQERIRQGLKELEAEQADAEREHQEKLQQREQKEKASGKKLRGRKPKPPPEEPTAKRNTTDPDSRIMTKKDGSYMQAYNAQAAVDADTGIILGGLVTQDANDQHQQNPVLDTIHENTGRYPKKLLEDAGYWNAKEVEKTPKGVDLYVATTQDWKRRKELRDQGSPRGRIPNDATPKERMERKLRTKKGAALYKLRGQTIEPLFGRIKEDQGIRGFLLRGLRKVAGEWDLILTAANVKRLWRLGAPI